MKTQVLYRKTMSQESTTGLLLIGCAVFSLLLANMEVGESYLAFWNHQVGGHPLSHWIDEGLMAVFFLLVGLDLKHEVMYGTLHGWRRCALPVLGAVGGMVVPVVVYLCFNMGISTYTGFGIPMATDIAFVLALLTLLGDRVPSSLKLFLIALAVVDDLGAVLVIALFYTAEVNLFYLLLSLMLFAFLFLIGHTSRPYWHGGVSLIISLYLVGGIGLWLLLMRSGVHATISGVLLAVAIPSFGGEHYSPSKRLQQRLHNPVYLIVLPLFILANTAIRLDGVWLPGHTLAASLTAIWRQPQVLGVAAGMLFGKPLGILMGAYVAVQYLGVAVPEGLTVRHFVGAAFLGGVGFTMAIFITVLSFENPYLVDTAKIAILTSSFVAALVGVLLLRE